MVPQVVPHSRLRDSHPGHVRRGCITPPSAAPDLFVGHPRVPCERMLQSAVERPCAWSTRLPVPRDEDSHHSFPILEGGYRWWVFECL